MTLIDWTPILVAVVGTIGSVYAVWRARKRDDAEASDKVSAAWERMNMPMLERIEKLEKRDEILRKRERLLWEYVDNLRSTLRANNIEAPPLPEMPKME
jgi:hypothetical protein